MIAILLAGAVLGQGAERSVSVGELLGRPVQEVRSRLVGVGDAPPKRGLAAVSPSGVLEIWNERGVIDRQAQGFLCMSSPDPTRRSWRTGELLWVFRSGRLAEVVEAPRSPTAAATLGASLRDGVDELLRRSARRLPASDRLAYTCLSSQDRAANHARNRTSTPANPTGLLQGLSLLSLAPLVLPVRAAENRAADRRSSGIIKQLRMGVSLGSDPAAFARSRPGVSLLPGGGPEYAVLAFEIGAQPLGNLARTHRHVLVGCVEGVWNGSTMEKALLAPCGTPVWSRPIRDLDEPV